MAAPVVILWLLRTLHGRGWVLVRDSALVDRDPEAPKGMAYLIDENMVVRGGVYPVVWPPGDPTLRDSLRTGAVPHPRPRWDVV
jgi:hypothetical protein